MGPWVSKSRPGNQLALAAGSVLVGSIMMFGFRGFSSAGGDALAGFLLGVMLLVMGIAGMAVSAEQTVTVDPRARRITVQDSYFVGSRSRVIPFGHVVSVSIGYLGKASNFVRNYYLVLHLIDGSDYSLFAPGRFFEGCSNRSTVEGWRQRLEEYMGSKRRIGG
jgi:hypothetical protein